MAIPTNAILKLVVSLAFPDSVVAQNVFWILFENDGGSNDDDDVLDDIEDYIEGMWTRIIGQVFDQINLDDVKVYIYDSGDDDFDEVGDRNLSVTFTNALDMLPHGVAAVSNGNTTNPDVQGRKFWGGFTEGSQVDGYLSGAVIASLALMTGDWMAPFTGAATGSGFVPGVYSLTKSAFYPFNLDTTTNLLLGYQRRRKPGVGI